ncbi:TrkH-domain-containing protein [Schizophyllum commune Loenen D]|nr:TrkH-domain-containing protein [Schizophyllum commune Loenen D]
MSSPADVENGHGPDGQANGDNPSSPPRTGLKAIWAEISDLNFFRVHLLAFTFIPLILSGIFYAAGPHDGSTTTTTSGDEPINLAYLDALFLCYSAMTVCGLATANLSALSKVQQVILYILMLCGNITTVSYCMLLVRMRYFRVKCEYVVKKELEEHRRLPMWMQRTKKGIIDEMSAPTTTEPTLSAQATALAPSAHATLIPSDGRGTPKVGVQHPTPGPTPAGTLVERDRHRSGFLNDLLHGDSDSDSDTAEEQFLSDAQILSSSPQSGNIDLPQLTPVASRASGVSLGHRSRAAKRKGTGVAFADAVERQQKMMERFPTRRGTTVLAPRGTMVYPPNLPQPSRKNTPARKNAVDMNGYVNLRAPVLCHHPPPYADPLSTRYESPHKYTGLGGFPGPAALLAAAARAAAPGVTDKLKNALEVKTEHHTGHDSFLADLRGRLRVWRNGYFETDELTEDDVEKIGGAEYRALRLLSYLVPAYLIGFQAISCLIFAPWLAATNAYADVFAAQAGGQVRPVTIGWFSVFQVMSSYTGGGMSLVDAGMVPFRNAWPMIVGMGLCILAGNHALPILLRFTIWVLSKTAGDRSELAQATEFLLKYPRRCFIYLFPAPQTWFLVICLVVFSAAEWLMFPVLNSGLPFYTALPAAERAVSGLFQGLAARASGFPIVPMTDIAPALQFLYMVMMYIAVYPVALSIRSTNVYEERSLGVFEAPEEDDDDEPDVVDQDMRELAPRERVGRYVGWHLRRQVSVDIWWLVWGVFLVAVIERGHLIDPDKKWFDLFRVIFELVSAFGGIGLSLGFPSDNYAFVGAMRPLSKIVVIIIMVRGRHRGLPVAVDRAVLLPRELVTQSSIPAADGANPEKPEGQPSQEKKSEESTTEGHSATIAGSTTALGKGTPSAVISEESDHAGKPDAVVEAIPLRQIGSR